MMRSLLFVLAIIALALAEQENIVKSESGQGPVNLLQDSIKELDLKKLEGKWYEIAASPIVHQTFEKGCDCLTTSFKPIQHSKFDVLNECYNRTTNKRVTVEGALTQLMADRHPGAFYIEFKQANTPGLNIVHAQKEKEQKENVKDNVKDQQTKEPVKDSSATIKDLKDIKDLKTGQESAIGQESMVGKGKEPNFLILKLVEDKAMLIAGSTVDAAWILARSQSLDRPLFKELMTFARAKGFSNMSHHTRCQQWADQTKQSPIE